ncbi:MAG: hypothetical protein OXB95_12115 [Rhodobacteraceae bacterium]|nr:hypothetical protein [Paracoccaceae bacterium]
MSYDFDLGPIGRTITTSSRQAQKWFDRGLAWTYAFNHDEATRCFNRAIEADPECAMAHWGHAYAVGPNYNRQWDVFENYELAPVTREAFESSRRAARFAANCSNVEKSLIQALQMRYQSAEPVADMQKWEFDYADVMRGVYSNNHDDVDVQVLFAEALMNRTPWTFWQRLSGDPLPGAATVEAREVLEAGILQREGSGELPHPALLHMYIHLMEGSRWPEKALDAADALRRLAPDSGHLLHMASHIDLLCGRYAEALEANTRAVAADKAYFGRENMTEYHVFYLFHNFHFMVFSAAFMGQRKEALRAVEEMKALLPRELLQVERPPMANWLEAFRTIEMHVMIRFGMWSEILDHPLPDDKELYSATTVTAHFARAVALAATGEAAAARREVEMFDRAFERLPRGRRLLGGEYWNIVAIEREFMIGEVEFREGNVESAFVRLRKAARMQDQLEYEQAWASLLPVRHALGALLLEKGLVEEAHDVYSEDLGFSHGAGRSCHRPDNVWALSGIVECLERMSEDKRASELRPRLEAALELSDVPIRNSCCCRWPD